MDSLELRRVVQEVLSIWPTLVMVDLVRYLIPAGTAFILLYVWEKNPFQHRKIQTSAPRIRQFRREFLHSMTTVAVFSLVGLGLYMGSRAGYTRVYEDIHIYGVPYFL